MSQEEQFYCLQMRSCKGVRESRCGKGQRGAELPRESWASCASSSGGAGSRTVSNNHGYREGYTSPSSFLAPLCVPESPQNVVLLATTSLASPGAVPGSAVQPQVLVASPVLSPGKGMEGIQAKEISVWLKAPPSPWAGQGPRGLVRRLVLSS